MERLASIIAITIVANSTSHFANCECVLDYYRVFFFVICESAAFSRRTNAICEDPNIHIFAFLILKMIYL